MKEDTSQVKLIRAGEATIAFHTVRHHQTYRSTDCTTELNKVIYKDSTIAKMTSCARTKTEAIVNGVLAPESIKSMKEDLTNISYLGVQTDASNHGSTKLFPICIQYFDYKNKGIQTKVVDSQTTKNETAETISNLILEVLKEHDL